MGQKCCATMDEKEIESHQGDLSDHSRIDQAQPETLRRISLPKGLNTQLFFEEMEDEEDDYNFFNQEDSSHTSIYRGDVDPEEYIFNYKGSNEGTQDKGNFKIVETDQKFPDLPTYVVKALEEVESSLNLMSRDIYTKNVYKLIYKGGKRVCHFQGNKKSIKGSGYCRMINEKGEYYEGLIKNYQILKGLMCLESHEFFFGSYINNACNGIIEQYCPNGDHFRGVMKEGLRHGKGKITWTDGSYYEGSFKHDIIHGNGFYKYHNGDVYDGYFVDGRKQGKGKILLIIL